jgi:iron complex outermembrane receptor protein
MTIRGLLLGSTSVLAIVGSPFAAHAQDVLETVIVTAEKQATDIQHTSVSVTAIQPDAMQDSGRTTLSDMIPHITAGVSLFQGQPQGGSYYVRGVGGGASVTELIDGVPIGAEFADQGGSGADVARIEVLRGPQGTLYGRGAFAGDINIVTNDPTDKYEGNVTVIGGARNRVAEHGMINIPLTDDFAFRINVASLQDTGFSKPTGQSMDDWSALHAKLLYKPTEDFRIVLRGNYNTDMNTGGNSLIPQVVLLQNFASPAFGGFNPCGGNPKPTFMQGDPWHSAPETYSAVPCTVPAQPPVNPSPVTGVCQQVPRQEDQLYDFGPEVDWNLGFSQLTLLADHAYNGSGASTGSNTDIEFYGVVPGNDRHSITRTDDIEARLSSPDDSFFKWIGGVYWERDSGEAHNLSRTSVTGVCAPTGCDKPTLTDISNKAAFGQVTIPIVDRFRIIGGLRYNAEDNTTTSEVLNFKTQQQTSKPSTESASWDKLSYKAGIEIDITPDVMLYANTASGFEPGSFANDAYCVGSKSGHRYIASDGAGADLPASSGGGCTAVGAGAAAVGGTPGETTILTPVTYGVTPNVLTAYEGGIKSRFFDNKVQINSEVYYYDFTSLTVSTAELNHANQNITTLVSVLGAKAYGDDLEASFLVSEHDRIDLTLSYEHSETGLSTFVLPICYNYGNATHPQITVLTSSANLMACAAKNLAANPATVNWVRYSPGVPATAPLTYAPTWSGNVTYQHIFDLSSGASVTAKGTVHFESETNVAQGGQGWYNGTQPAYHMTDLSLTYNTADGKWSLSGWVRNVENLPIIQAALLNTGSNYVSLSLAPPRTWGVTLNAKF